MIAARARALSLSLSLAVALAAALAGGGCGPQVIDAVGKDPCVVSPDSERCAPLEWPNALHSTNSEPWLIEHHDELWRIRPRVLVLSFFNATTAEDARKLAQRQADALALGSQYHGYSVPDAPPFLQYEIVDPVIDLADRPVPAGWTHPSSSRLPVNTAGAFDYVPLFSKEWADVYGIPDDADPTHNLTLCELFEKGKINELWLEVGEDAPRAPPLMAERKQLYDASNQPVRGTFVPNAGSEPLDNIACQVTVRMAHLSPVRRPDCDLQVRGFGLQSMSRALPYLAPDASAFMNSDFTKQFGTRFNGWTELCDNAGTPCVTYPTSSSAVGVLPDTWTIPSFIQGCGTPQFPPNARFRWDYMNTAPVQSRCEHFGMHDGPNGKDLLDLYDSSKSDRYTAAIGGFDCGGGWEVYWRQSIPGLHNSATDVQGRPMKNWWPFLFY